MIEPGWWFPIAVIFAWLAIPGFYLVINKQARPGVYLLFSVYLLAFLGLPIAVFVFASLLTGGIVLPLFLAIALYLLSMVPVASRVGYKTRGGSLAVVSVDRHPDASGVDVETGLAAQSLLGRAPGLSRCTRSTNQWA